MGVGTLLGATDRYVWRARIRPVVLALLPIALPVAAVVPEWANGGRLWALVQLVLAGLLLLAEPLGRARGKRMEPELFRVWGGKPSIQLLRWSGPMNRTQLVYLRTRVQEIVGNSLPLPSEDEERSDLVTADEVYETVGTVLRGRARALAGAGLLAEHNCEYGFRRNALGLRHWALTAAALGTGGLVCAIVWAGAAGETIAAGQVVLWSALIVADVAVSGFWYTTVRTGWVETAAWEYAYQLYETVNLPDAAGPATGAT
ncbi:hypothetical protein [Streptomyces sp. NPDC047070]|uniref:hypothetical protein n=1 Tax=Streptomyces sp. NPDC047070 TaxID=3154923 RepID=UPI003456CBD0